MSQHEIAIAKELFTFKTFVERMVHAAKLLGMTWQVKRRNATGDIVHTEVTGNEGGLAIVADHEIAIPIYGEQLLLNEGETPWLIDEKDPAFIEVNRILTEYNRVITAPLYKSMRDILPFSKLLVDRFPIYNDHPQFATYLAVNPLNETDGYRINKDGKFAWWTGSGKHRIYDVIEFN
ncbi:hypothetical protein RVBP21_2400 [Pseudomonas phage BRkr]|nr:hypothetical protein RVBP21_2400 [Pseudomonas phage BRkr]